MNHEMKLLAKKLTAIFLSLMLTVGLVPANVTAAEGENEFSFELLDYEETYYNGFNDKVAVATGTFIELNYGEDSNYIDVKQAVAKEEGSYHAEEILINGDESAEARVVYQDGQVYIKVFQNEEELYSEALYTPQYVELSDMPTISLNEEVTVADGVERYCEQYYRVNVSTVPGTYKAYTIVLNDEDDTYMSLYNANGRRLKKNDTTDEEDESIDASITFTMPETGERIIGVRGYERAELTATKLKLVTGAKEIVSFESDNINQLDVFYEGFNDYLLYATGTRIQATLDNGDVRQWQADDYYFEFDADTGMADIDLEDVEAQIYRGEDNDIYADYGLTFDQSSKQTKKLYTQVIKPVAEIPSIEEGTTNIDTLPWAGAYSYYRMTAAEQGEIWTLHFTYAGEEEDYSKLIIRGFDENGSLLLKNYQRKDEAGVLGDLEVEIEVPAGETRVVAIFDDADQSQTFTMTATKEELPEEETTLEEESTDEDVTTAEGESTDADETTVDGESQDPDKETAEGESTDADVTNKGDNPTEEETTKYDPGFNPADLTYDEIACNGNDDAEKLEYSVQDTDMDGIVPWYGDNGNTFMIQYADPNGEGSSADVKINGQEPEAGVVTETATGLVKVDPTKLPDDTYSVIEVTLASGKKTTVVVKKGNPTDEPSSGETTEDATTADTQTSEEVSTTEEATTAEVTSADVTTEQTTAEVTTTAAEVITTVAETTTKANEVTTTAKAASTKIKVGKAKLKKNVKKKKAAKKIKVTLKKLVKKATGYEIRVYKKKKQAKKNKKAIAKKVIKKNKKKLTVSGKKLKGKTRLWIRVRAYRVVGGKKYYGKWSAIRVCKKK